MHPCAALAKAPGSRAWGTKLGSALEHTGSCGLRVPEPRTPGCVPGAGAGAEGLTLGVAGVGHPAGARGAGSAHTRARTLASEAPGDPSAALARSLETEFGTRFSVPPAPRCSIKEGVLYQGFSPGLKRSPAGRTVALRAAWRVVTEEHAPRRHCPRPASSPSRALRARGPRGPVTSCCGRASKHLLVRF